LRALDVCRRGIIQLLCGRPLGRFAGSIAEEVPSGECRWGVLGVFIPLACAHLLDRAAHFVVEGLTRAGIVAQAAELILDALGLRIGRV
jgi:hypothetical protein